MSLISFSFNILKFYNRFYFNFKKSNLITDPNAALEDNQLSEVKRRRNVYIPDGPGLEIVPYLESEMTDPMEKDLKIQNGLEDYIKQSLDAQENANDFNQCWSLKSMSKELF